MKKSSFFLFGRMQNENGSVTSIFEWGCFPNSKDAEMEAERLKLVDFFWLEVLSIGPKQK